ncbi:hotdog fold thioesterase [Anaerospora sp.]|uniref:hotdog fold thioesterase n=1 Tax=Anaerospora sp. TaxID=1960278 RepID=UPI0037C19512
MTWRCISVLAESVASLGAYNLIDQSTHYAVGLEINANHIRSKREGMVTAVGVPLHKGRTTMVWEMKILDEEHKLICIFSVYDRYNFYKQIILSAKRYCTQDFKSKCRIMG